MTNGKIIGTLLQKVVRQKVRIFLLKKLIFNVSTSEKRIAIIEDNQVTDLRIQQPSEQESAGNIYCGRVTDVLPGMQAAFVDIGQGKNGYIHRNQLLDYHLSDLPEEVKNTKSISSFVREGQEILVQVIKEGVGGKGPKLTGLIELPGTHLVYLPNGKYVAVSRKMKTEQERERWRVFAQETCEHNEGLIIRTASESKCTDVILQEVIQLRRKYYEIVKEQKSSKAPTLLFDTNNLVHSILQEFPIHQISEVIVDDFETFTEIKNHYSGIESLHYFREKENIFSHYGVEHQIDLALKRVVWLKSGAYLIVEKTEALTVIDVNTGKFQGKINQRDTILKTNLEAAKEIARQLRLRDIGGMIVVDFIDMKSVEDQKKVINVFKDATQNDRNRVRVLGFTQLGILEVTRKKVRPSLEETLRRNCQVCSGDGRVMSNESIAYRLERSLWELRGMDHEAVWVETTNEVKGIVEGKNKEHLRELEQLLHFSIIITSSESVNDSFILRHRGMLTEINERINVMD